MPLSDMALAALVQLLWGTNFVAAKVGVDAMPPLLFTALRFVLAAAVLLPFVPRPRGSQWRAVLVLSTVFGAAHFGFLFSGLKHVDAATAAVVIQTGPPFSALLGVLLFREVIGWRRILGLALAFSGIVVVAGEPQMTSLVPIVLLLIGAFTWALGNVVAKTSGDLPVLSLSGWMALFAIPQLALMSWLLEDGHLEAMEAAPWQSWAGLVYTAIGASVIAHSLWYALMRRHPMSVVAPWGLLAPVLGIAAGILILGEAATWQKLVGGAVTLTGVAIIQVRSARRGRPVGPVSDGPAATGQDERPHDRAS